jgi:isopentenyl-diphosphate delta-isomerase
MAKPEQIVLVTENGQPTGEFLPKLEAHHIDTPLHLAFSCYVFNEQGKFLVTQRALSKKVWPGVWTNSVCGHPAPDEDSVEAIKRRLQYELGMEAKDFEVLLPTYRYTTPPYKGIIENEYCPVYIARATSEPQPNPEEVEAYKWMDWSEYVAELEAHQGDVYSWWCKDQLKQLHDHPLIAKYSKK